MSLNFDKYAQEGNRFMKELSQNLGHPEDQNATARILRAVLHSIRDRIAISESLDFLSQLPMFLKAVYVEQWKYNEDVERINSIEGFKEKVKQEQAKWGEREFAWEISTEEIIKTVFNTLEKYTSPGQMEHLRGMLLAELQELIEINHE
ncbi:MAG: DUF2267 domain-containing protein [Bacteroidota bacterium]|nr:DUF2267 domain-containing protein [Bacteroidota bacterium]